MGECINNIGFIFSKAKTCVKNKRKYGNCLVTSFKLDKSDFVTSTLDISTSQEESWNNFKNNIINWVNGYFVISVTKCDKLHSFGAKLMKIKVCECCDVVYLYFNFNIIPNSVNDTCNNNNSVCFPLTSASNVPSGSCFPPNYWPNTNAIGKTDDFINPPCANTVGNFFYNLESTYYYDVKFYYNEKYCTNLCFKKTIC